MNEAEVNWLDSQRRWPYVKARLLLVSASNAIVPLGKRTNICYAVVSAALAELEKA